MHFFVDEAKIDVKWTHVQQKTDTQKIKTA